MNYSEKLLLVCDLDRTVLPDGPHPISKNAMLEFNEFVNKDRVILGYATGRSLDSTIIALKEYRAPLADFIIGDVGTSIYFLTNERYIYNKDWEREFEKDWRKTTANNIKKSLEDLSQLRLQELINQNKYKVSYYVPLDKGYNNVKHEIKKRLKIFDINIEILITANEIDRFCYLDIIPKSATKERALNYLIRHLEFSVENVVYAGDSGNDLGPLTTGCKSIVVNNASIKFKKEVKNLAKKKYISKNIYFAKGVLKGNNGNYAGGILEGLKYFGYL